MSQKALRDELHLLLRGDRAHVDFERAMDGIPARLRSARSRGIPHTLWELLEHLRIAQWDILEYCRDPEHVSPEFPAGYWPGSASPPDGKAWRRSITAFRRDLRSMQKLIANPKHDLLAPIPHAQGASLLHEALLLADHNAYHIGQMVFLRRRLGAWTGA